MKWIKCTEKLPPECEPVLIYVPNQGSTVAYLVYSSSKSPIQYVIVDFDEFEQYLNLNDVTHWMELPEPPTYNQSKLISEYGGILRTHTSDGRIVNAADELNRIEREKK